MTDPFDDDALTAALRRRAEQLTGDVHTERALGDVRRRATRRRIGRAVMAGAIAAASVAVVAGGVLLVGGDEPVVRTPATAPAPTPAPAPAPSPPPSSEETLPTSPPLTAPAPTVVPPPATVAPMVPPTVAPTVPEGAPPVPPAPPASTDIGPRTYSGIGGSITVAVTDGRLGLVGAPSPAGSYATEIQDNGPDRVRVRFDDGQRRTEIRVDLENGTLVPRVDEG